MNSVVSWVLRKQLNTFEMIWMQELLKFFAHFGVFSRKIASPGETLTFRIEHYRFETMTELIFLELHKSTKRIKFFWMIKQSGVLKRLQSEFSTNSNLKFHCFSSWQNNFRNLMAFVYNTLISYQIWCFSCHHTHARTQCECVQTVLEHVQLENNARNKIRKHFNSGTEKPERKRLHENNFELLDLQIFNNFFKLFIIWLSISKMTEFRWNSFYVEIFSYYIQTVSKEKAQSIQSEMVDLQGTKGIH